MSENTLTVAGVTVDTRHWIGGERVAIGFAGLVDGPLDAPGARAEALRRAAACGYLGVSEPPDQEGRR